MYRVFLILFLGLILLAYLSTMMYGYWLALNYTISYVQFMLMTFLPLFIVVFVLVFGELLDA